MRLSDIQALTRTVAVPLAQGEILISYYPTKINRATQSKYGAISAAIEAKTATKEALTPEEEETSARFLCELIADWDVELAEGEKAPLTPAFLIDELGFEITRQITSKIMEAVNPND